MSVQEERQQIKKIDIADLVNRARQKAAHSQQGSAVDRAVVEFYEPDKKAATGNLMTVEQVCKLFKITPMTLNNWRSKRKFPFLHLKGGRKPPVRFDEGLVRQWALLNSIPTFW